jgi:hypothetical protein
MLLFAHLLLFPHSLINQVLNLLSIGLPLELYRPLLNYTHYGMLTLMEPW